MNILYLYLIIIRVEVKVYLFNSLTKEELFNLCDFSKIKNSEDFFSLIFFNRVYPLKPKNRLKNILIYFYDKIIPAGPMSLFYISFLSIVSLEIMNYIVNLFYPSLSAEYRICILFLIAWIWILSIFVLSCIELYITLVYALDPNYIKLSEDLPSFIKNWYHRLRDDSRLKSEAWILRSRLYWLYCMGIMILSFVPCSIFVVNDIFISKILFPH